MPPPPHTHTHTATYTEPYKVFSYMKSLTCKCWGEGGGEGKEEDEKGEEGEGEEGREERRRGQCCAATINGREVPLIHLM